jgi:hypothetical protein
MCATLHSLALVTPNATSKTTNGNSGDHASSYEALMSLRKIVTQSALTLNHALDGQSSANQR